MTRLLKSGLGAPRTTSSLVPGKVSGNKYLVGAGVYNMKMDNVLIEDVVDRAAALVAAHGPGGFDRLRSKTGPFRFMDVYVFVTRPDGLELVNP